MSGDGSGMLFVELAVQLVDFDRGAVESFAAGGRDAVDPASATGNDTDGRGQQTAAFETVEQRVQGSGADPVAVVRQFLDHGEPKDRLVRGMQQHMDADKAGKELWQAFCHTNTIPPASRMPSSVIELRYMMGEPR